MNKFIFIVCSLFVINTSVFGQKALEKDLSESFKKYDLVKLDGGILMDKAKTEQPIEIQAYGRYFQFVLSPNDLRADDYRAFENIGTEDRELQPQAEVTTYKGKLSDDVNSEVRFTITAENIEGFIYTGNNEKFFITLAEKFSTSAQPGDAVVYSEDDLLKTVDLSDDIATPPVDIETKMDLGIDILKTYNHGLTSNVETIAAAAADVRVIEVATEADYQWLTQAGGAAAANNEILGILNLVDGIYRRELNLTIKVTFQHGWSTPDSYSTASTSALLNAFLAHWNATYPLSQFPRDVAHLFTGKFSNQGIAYTGITCRSQSYAYGLTGRSNINHLIAAHEIGHNIGADHIDNLGSCALSLMNPILSSGVTGFCEVSKTAIVNYIFSFGSCLNSTGTTTPAPTPTVTPTPTTIGLPIPTPTACNYSLTLNSQDFPATGGSGNATVRTQQGCSYSSTNNSSFITITSGQQGTGDNSVVIFTVSANSGIARTGTLTVAGQTFTVNQAGSKSRKRVRIF